MKQPDTTTPAHSVMKDPSPPPRYAARNLQFLEPYYSKHVAAMTEEGLHSKSDIAAELAIRDIRIGQLLTAIRDGECGEGWGDNMNTAIAEDDRLVRASKRNP